MTQTVPKGDILGLSPRTREMSREFYQIPQGRVSEMGEVPVIIVGGFVRYVRIWKERGADGLGAIVPASCKESLCRLIDGMKTI